MDNGNEDNNLLSNSLSILGTEVNAVLLFQSIYLERPNCFGPSLFLTKLPHRVPNISLYAKHEVRSSYCGEFRVDDKNVLAPEFSLLALVFHWSLTNKFHHTIMESIEVWASRCFKFTSGPLLQNGRSH